MLELDWLLAVFPNFVRYVVSGFALTLLFLWTYVLITPWREFALIRAGNSAAAIACSTSIESGRKPLSSIQLETSPGATSRPASRFTAISQTLAALTKTRLAGSAIRARASDPSLGESASHQRSACVSRRSFTPCRTPRQTLAGDRRNRPR